MKFRFLHLAICLTGLLASCSGGPAEDEVKKRITGVYCAGHSKLEINEDGTYSNQRVHKSPLSNSPVMERCEGTWKLEWGEGWALVLSKSTKNSNPVSKCSGSTQSVWKDGDYLSKEGEETLVEMFDQLKVSKNNCE